MLVGDSGGLDICRRILRIKSGSHAITPPGFMNRVFGSKAWHVHGLHFTSPFSECSSDSVLDPGRCISKLSNLILMLPDNGYIIRVGPPLHSQSSTSLSRS